jgi:hypothetical protein
MPAGKRGELPGFEQPSVGVVLEREEDSSPPNVLVAFETGTGMPAVSRELLIGRRHELLALSFGLANEEHERRRWVAGVWGVAPPPAQEGVVAPELLVVLVDAAGAVVLDEDGPLVAVVAGEFKDRVGPEQSGAGVAEVLGGPVVFEA